MSFNRWMHPRNIFRTKPDFKVLAEEFPEFEPFLKRFYNDNVTIDYKNPDALRTLCRILLKKFFSLDVHLPPARLIPAIPQRLNYVLWIEDLVSLLDTPADGKVSGIDIGTGPSCIFPFLICRNNKSWCMTAFEIDPESHSIAVNNVAQNNLSNRISVILNQDHSSKFSWIFQSIGDSSFQFLMCNPPFFKKQNDLNTSEFTEEIDNKSASNESSEVESSFEGGEVSYVEEIIEESLVTGTRIKIYSVMLGKKSSLITLKRTMNTRLANGQITSFTFTEFCQGKTMRWGLAWTSVPNLNLNQIPKPRNKGVKKLTYDIEYKKGLDYSIEGISTAVKDLLLNDLKIDTLEQTRLTKHSCELLIRSNTNTWSHQRRKRRQDKQVADLSDHSLSPKPNLDLKRKRDDSDDEYETADPCQNISDQKRIKDIELCTSVKNETMFLLDAILVIKKDGKSIKMVLEPGDRCSNRESVNQLLQYFKNSIPNHKN